MRRTSSHEEIWGFLVYFLDIVQWSTYA